VQLQSVKNDGSPLTLTRLMRLKLLCQWSNCNAVLRRRIRGVYDKDKKQRQKSRRNCKWMRTLMLVAWRDIGQRLAVFLLISLNGTERRAVSLQLLIFFVVCFPEFRTDFVKL